GLSGTGPKAGGPLYVERLRRSPTLAARFAAPAASVQQGALPELVALREWAVARNDNALAELCANYADTTPLGRAVDLPGPTGERNQETLHPRGRVWCAAGEPTALLQQLAAVFATGNRALIAAQGRALLPRDLAPRVNAAIEDIVQIERAD